ncbi:MAG: NAD(P)-dependent oxidoreductase [Dehalococcoidia bacterium]|nr:NAD(P)-dependent oxidoreductase [Dehalococcoidia bacterium]
MNVGFIGLGRMGMPMSRRLLEAGFPLTVHNRSRPKVDELAAAGAVGASSAAEVAGASTVVLTCLPDVSTVEEVFLGKDGIVSVASPGQVLVDHSTVGPSTSRAIAEAAEARGASFLDAPISGGVERAAEGTLTIMAGGPPDAFETALPVFRAYGGNVRRVGGVGSGSVFKLINQLLVSVHSLAAAEAMLLGGRAGVDLDALQEVLATSWGSSFMLSRNGPVIASRDFDDARAPLRLFVKDLGLAQEYARDLNANSPLGERTLQVVERAISDGLGELDVSSLVLPLEGPKAS